MRVRTEDSHDPIAYGLGLMVTKHAPQVDGWMDAQTHDTQTIDKSAELKIKRKIFTLTYLCLRAVVHGVKFASFGQKKQTPLSTHDLLDTAKLTQCFNDVGTTVHIASGPHQPAPTKDFLTEGRSTGLKGESSLIQYVSTSTNSAGTSQSSRLSMNAGRVKYAHVGKFCGANVCQLFMRWNPGRYLKVWGPT
jgi:hypothetical protein